MILIITIITIIMIIYLNLSEQTSDVIYLTEEAIEENDDDENLKLNAEEDKVSEDKLENIVQNINKDVAVEEDADATFDGIFTY